MQDLSFQPADLTVEVGTTITWRHEDSGLTHTTTAHDGTWASGQTAEGDEFTFTFDEPGTYDDVCDVHPSQMTGTIIVTGSG